MAVDHKLVMGRKKVLVGIRFDNNSKELLDWALVKVADPGDIVVPVYVCRNSGSKEKALLDAYLEEYQGLCNKKQVALTPEIFKGHSMRKILVREANSHSASAVLVGTSKHSPLRGWGSIANYCANKLPSTTQVMAIYNGKVVFSSCTTNHLGGAVQDPKPSLYLKSNFTFKDNCSEFGESEISEFSRFSFDGRDNIIFSNDEVGRDKRCSLRSISLPAEDFMKQRPGWPLLQTASSITQPALEARKLSVVRWVMTLPHRPLSDLSESSSPTSTEDSGNGVLADISTRDMLASYQIRLPKDLELIFRKNSADCEVFSYDFLKASTSEFSTGNLIGKGGSNSVYKGILPEGKPVAVKILESSKESWKEFIHDVDIMTTLKHKSITPLLGICVEGNNLISVYDLLSRGNLEENLYGNRIKGRVLQWESRFQIAVGIAEALNYLHHGCPRPVIHRDIKSSNILLNDEFEPQLSDFGLAIWGPTKASFLMDSDVVGTFGYLAPEYFMYGKVSNKIDIYAFGVVLLELLSGRKSIGLETDKGEESLLMWAKPKLESGDFKSILDRKLDGNIDESQMQRMVLAASRCLTQAARLRPDMSQIVSILNGEECEKGIKLHNGFYDDPEDEDINDDEVYPESCAESHLSLAFLDVNEDVISLSSLDQSNSPLSVEEYLRKRCSRCSSLEPPRPVVMADHH